MNLCPTRVLLQGEWTAPLAKELTECSDIQQSIGIHLNGAVMKVNSENNVKKHLEWMIFKANEKI
jgi:hypothetical protein